MNNTPVLDLNDRQNKDNIIKPKNTPFFLIIQKAENKEIKIPCSSESVAKKLLVSYSNNYSNCKVFLMRN